MRAATTIRLQVHVLKDTMAPLRLFSLMLMSRGSGWRALCYKGSRIRQFPRRSFNCHCCEAGLGHASMRTRALHPHFSAHNENYETSCSRCFSHVSRSCVARESASA
jgi:hypothetical protein